MNDKKIKVELSPEELRYLISCGFALSQNVTEQSLATYCNLKQITEFSNKLRKLADKNNIDM